MTQPPSSPQMVLGKHGTHMLTPATQCDSKRIKDFSAGAAAMKPLQQTREQVFMTLDHGTASRIPSHKQKQQKEK